MYVEVLRMCPSLQLMHALVAADDQGSRPLPVGVVILTVLENNSFDLVLPFIQELQNKTADGEKKFRLIKEKRLSKEKSF